MWSRVRIGLAALGVVVAAVLAGYVWGRSGRADLEASLENRQARLGFSVARAALLDARVSLYNLNFGEASRHIELAQATLKRLSNALRSGGAESTTALDEVIGIAEDAQGLAGKLDQAANTRVAEAVRRLDLASSRYTVDQLTDER
jgi:hypothetical protein